ncbi:MAG: hypothetical protein ABH833_00625 [Parcubacteria group bacterium]
MLRRILQSWIFTVAILLIVFFILSGLLDRFNKLEDVDKEIVVLEEKIADLGVSSNTEISGGGASEVDERNLEKQARLTLNYRDPDEKVVYVYRNKEKNTEKPDPYADMNNLEKWVRYLWNY